MKKLSVLLACIAVLCSIAVAPVRALTADILFVVDESGSMSGEHNWIKNMVLSLENDLIAAGASGNRYGLVGFGANASHGIPGHTHLVGGAAWGTAAQLSTAAGTLVVSGGTEDGYSGIMHALSYTFRPDAAVNIILITDEDRDILSGSTYNYNNVLAALEAKNALLNVVVDATYKKSGISALGVDSEGDGYKADGSGGYLTDTGFAFSTDYGTTRENYIEMAWDTGGAFWDLNQLRSGGLIAQSFTEAFVDIKVQEIQQQIPESGFTVGLLLFSMMSVVGLRRLF